MTKFMIVPKEDWEIINKYINNRNFGMIVLLPEQVLETLTEKQADEMRRQNDGYIEYDFGEEADYFLDVI